MSTYNLLSILVCATACLTVFGCKPKPAPLTFAYIAAPGRSPGIVDRGERYLTDMPYNFTGVAASRSGAVLVGYNRDLTSGNRAFWYDKNTHTAAALALPEDFSALGSYVGLYGDCAVLVGKDQLLLLDPNSHQLVSQYSAPGAESPAFGCPSVHSLVYPRSRASRLSVLDIKTGLVKDLSVRGEHISPVGCGDTYILLAIDNTVVRLTFGDTGDTTYETLRSVDSGASAAIPDQGHIWIAYTIDYFDSTASYIENENGTLRGATLPHAIFQLARWPQ